MEFLSTYIPTTFGLFSSTKEVKSELLLQNHGLGNKNKIK